MVDMDEASHSSDYDTAPELLDASGQFIANHVAGNLSCGAQAQSLLTVNPTTMKQRLIIFQSLSHCSELLYALKVSVTAIICFVLCNVCTIYLHAGTSAHALFTMACWAFP